MLFSTWSVCSAPNQCRRILYPSVLNLMTTMKGSIEYYGILPSISKPRNAKAGRLIRALMFTLLRSESMRCLPYRDLDLRNPLALQLCRNP